MRASKAGSRCDRRPQQIRGAAVASALRSRHSDNASRYNAYASKLCVGGERLTYAAEPEAVLVPTSDSVTLRAISSCTANNASTSRSNTCDHTCRPVPRVDELRRHANVVAVHAHAAFEHGPDVELASDLGHGGRACAKSERRGPRGHAQLAHVGERMNDLFAQAGCEPGFARVVAEILERHHGDGSGVWHRAGSVGATLRELPRNGEHDGRNGNGSGEQRCSHRHAARLRNAGLDRWARPRVRAATAPARAARRPRAAGSPCARSSR